MFHAWSRFFASFQRVAWLQLPLKIIKRVPIDNSHKLSERDVFYLKRPLEEKKVFLSSKRKILKR